jgi:quinol monooxygenase YgiN
MIIVIGSCDIQESKFPQALAISQAHVARSRQEPGCIAHSVHQDTEAPLRLVFLEKWCDQQAIAAHFKVPESRAFVKQLAALATEPPTMELFEASEVTF